MTLRSLRSVRLLVQIALAAAVAGCAGPGPTTSPLSGSPGPSAASPGPSSASPGPAVSVAPGAAFDPARVGLALEPVVGGLSDPLAVTHAGDGSGRLFVAEQEGTDPDRPRRRRSSTEPFLDISERISAGGERGLLGLAFHPDFPTDPRFFVNYTDPNGDTRVSSFAVDPAAPDRADPGSEVRLLSIGQPYANHNGGALAFGPDGFLYIATGDGGSGGDPHGNGQSLETLLGKILRIDVDTDRGRPRLRDSRRQPVRRSGRRAAGDLRIRDAKPVADELRSGERGPVDRRRRPGRLGGDRRRAGPGRRARTSAGTGWRALTASGRPRAARSRRSCCRSPSTRATSAAR